MANTHFGIKINKPLEASSSVVKKNASEPTSQTQANKTVEEDKKDSQTSQSIESQATQESQKAPDNSKKPSSSSLVSLKNPNIPGLPFKKGDSVIKAGDSGKNVEWIQDFLQSLPEVQESQNFLADYGKGYSLTDSFHYSKYELDTRKHLRDYQNKNYSRYQKYSQLSNADLDSEINSGVVSFAIVNVMLEDKGEFDVIQEGKEKIEPISEVGQRAIPDPPESNRVSEATFFVKTKNSNHRLALRKSPAFSKVSKEASEDEDKKGERVSMMPNETLIKVITPYVGYNCEWHQVEVVDADPIWDGIKELQKTQKLFAYAEFVYPLSKTPSLPSVFCDDCKEAVSNSERKLPFPNWVSLTPCDVFFDSETAAYYIIVESISEGITKEELPAVKKQAMYEGISNLLDFYDKENGKDRILKIIEVLGNTALEDQDYFLEERPNSRLKFLVSLPKKYFDPIPRRQEFFNNVPTVGGIMPKEWRTTVLKYSELRAGVDIVANRFNEYGIEIKNWDGEVLDYDIEDEAKKLQSFIPVFEKFLKWNEVILKEDLSNVFEIGFSGPCFQLLYVLEKKENVMVPLRVGIECFKFSEPVVFERTMGYVFYILEMVKDIQKEKRRWISFVNSYTCPLARIVPSGNRVQDERRLEKKINNSSVKTTSEKIREDEQIKNVKPKLVSLRGFADYIGDPLFTCEGGMSALDRVKDVRGLYKEILNKVDIKVLASFAISCFVTKLTIAELNALACDYVLSSLKYDQLMKVIDLLGQSDLAKFQEKLVIITSDRRLVNVDPTIKFRMALKESVSKQSICKAINILDPSLTMAFVKKLTIPFKQLARERPKIPTISLKAFLPTEDTLREIRENLENGIKEAISQGLFVLIRIAFQSLCSLCSRSDFPREGGGYGDDNLNDILGDNNIEPKDIDLSDFGIPSDCEDIKDFFDDLSNMLTPGELCSLLDGAAPMDILNVIKNLLKNKYPCLSTYMNDTYKIKKIFEHLGSFVNPSICRDLSNQIGEIPQNLCEEKENIKRILLENRLSKDLIEEQIAKEKERSKELLKSLVQLSEDNVLNKFIPPITKNNCDKAGANTTIATSLVVSNPPSVQKLNDQIVDVMFNPIEESFNGEMKRFIDDMIVREKITDMVSQKELYDIERKTTEELTPEDQYKRIDELTKYTLNVLPSLKRSLQTQENFVMSKTSYLNYDYKLSRNDKQFDNIMKKVIEKSINVPIVQAEGNNKLGFVPNIEFAKAVIQEVCEEEESPIFSINNDILAKQFGMEMGSDTLIRYFFQPYEGDTNSVKDSFMFKLNDVELGKEFLLGGGIKIEDGIRNYIAQFKLEKGLSINQNVLSNLLLSKWMDNLTDTSRKKVVEDKKLFDYLKNEAFSEMVTTLMRRVSLQVSNSSLFMASILENVDFVPNQESGNECGMKEVKSLLDIDSTKEKARENHEKESNVCQEKLDKTFMKMDSIERAGLVSAIDNYVKLFVIENFLRGMFCFSDFKINDMFGDGLIVNYLSKRIQEDIKKQSEDFFQLILQVCKNSVASRGSGLVDPYSTDLESDIESEENKIVNEKDPKWVSGEKALEFLIKENIKSFSSAFDDMLGYEKTNDIYRLFLDIWYNPNDYDIQFDGKYFKEYVANGKGDFIVQRYIRICGEKEEDRKVYSITEAIPAGQQFVYGIRLSYIPSPSVNFQKGYMFDLEVDESISKREKSFINVSKTDEVFDDTDTRRNYIFPIVAIEEEEYRVDKLQGQELQFVIDGLKEKMIKDKEFRALFEFVFPLRRFLSLTCIYTMMSTSILIKGIDQRFGMTKRLIKNLIGTLLPSEGDWWKKKSIMPNNEDLRKQYTDNAKTSGPAPQFAGLAAQTIPILIKGMAEKFDPCYGTMKAIWDTNPDALIGGLTWASIAQLMPMNFFPLIGWGPPLMAFGTAALSVGLLPGEKNHENKMSQKGKEMNRKKCIRGNK